MYADFVRCEPMKGRFLYFPKQYAKLVEKKRDLIEQAMDLKDQGRFAEASKLAFKIISLNRRIPPVGISEEQYNLAMGA